MEAFLDSFKDFLKITLFDNTMEAYLWFFGIILVAIFFKRFVSRKVTSLVFKFFARIMPKSDPEQDGLLKLLIRPLEFLIMVLAVYFAFNTLSFSGIEDGTRYKSFINIIFNILIVIMVTWCLIRMVDYLAVVMAKRAEKTTSKVDDQIVLFFREAAKLLVIITSILFIVGSIFKLDVGSLVAGLGIGGLAIALAAQDTLKNLLASFIIFFDQPFQVGDFINVGGTYGVVEKIGFRSTRIRTLEKSYLTVPNDSLINRELDNLSLRTFRRAKFHVGLTYGTTIEQIQNIIRDVQQYIDDYALTNQDGLVKFEEFGDSSLNLMVLYYVETQDWGVYLKVREEINFKIMEIVAAHGSDFAFPTQTVHLQKEN